MAKFLVIWRMNPNAPWPTDPAESAKIAEPVRNARQLVKYR